MDTWEVVRYIERTSKDDIERTKAMLLANYGPQGATIQNTIDAYDKLETMVLKVCEQYESKLRSNKKADGIELAPCKVCGGHAGLERSGSVFVGQIYSREKYPEKVARQNHGYKVRCQRCGLQTCWWHYEREAVFHWNSDPEDWAV